MADKGFTGLVGKAAELYQKKGVGAIWDWAMEPDGPHGKAKRFTGAEKFAEFKREHTSDSQEAREWGKRRVSYAKARDEWERKYKNRLKQDDWPSSLRVVEHLYHAPGPHFHLASLERAKLIEVCKIIDDKFNCRIGEFPPFDDVECVHTGTSYHYRTSSGIVLACNSSRLNLGGDAGCAADINDWDGGNDDDYAAYLEVGRRYVWN